MIPALAVFGSACASPVKAQFHAEMAISAGHRYACSTLVLAGTNRIDSTLSAWALPGGELLWGNHLGSGLTQVGRFIGNGEMMEISTYNPKTKAEEIGLVETATGKSLRKYPTLPPQSMDHTVTPDGKLIISGNRDGTLTLIDLETGKELRTIQAHPHSFQFWAVSPNSALAGSCSKDEPIKVWSLPSGDLLKILGQGRGTPWYRLAFSPDGSVLAAAGLPSTGEIAQIELFDLASGKVSRMLEVYREKINWITFSPDGRRLAAHSSCPNPKYHLARLWDVSTGKELPTMFKFPELPNSPCSPTFLAFWIDFTPEGRCILLGRETQDAKQLSMWDLESGEVLHKFPVP
jgi:WD40 repeat protein